jgi:hypothetical protein
MREKGKIEHAFLRYSTAYGLGQHILLWWMDVAPVLGLNGTGNAKDEDSES